MKKDKTINFLSFIFSTLIYILIILSILFFAYNSKTKYFEDQKYTKDKDAFMDIMIMDIDDSLAPVSKDSKELEDEKEEIIEKKPNLQDEDESLKTTNKKVPSKEEKKETPKPVEKPKNEELSDLFKDINKTKLEENIKQEDLVQSRKKSDKTTKTTQKSSSKSNTSNIKGEKAKGKSQRTGVYNKFIGEVQSILTNVWSTYRALPNQDATVEITIDKNGRLSYEIIELSYSTEFNQKFRDYLNRLENIQFPAPPDGEIYKHKYKMKDLIR
ncbi:TonB C-terminal domain-containing protein [Campylobacter ureolyticus]|uniref:TonB C-terminal domain-containing protein n=1 Tax=Campylobacter ureolyticus TaxID=827 RepID=UPI00290E684E|nr:TonB C-terminal domain-containing protein [Campylobacter ureolyticus]MDU7069883.1 TonB C-terminal domain-containing protein [Campylobacter ureolyticus]